MGSYTVSVFASLDGFTAGPGGDLSALPFDATFNDHNLELLRRSDTLLSGAVGFRDFLSYWPEIADDADADPVEREISRINNTIDKLVVSDSMTTEDLGVWRDTTRVVYRAEAADEVVRLTTDLDATVLTFGSNTTWNPLLSAGLVDELLVMLGAGLLGQGVPIIGPQAATNLALRDIQRRDDSDNPVLRYTPAA